MFVRLGQFCVRKRWVVLAAWLIGLVLLGALTGIVGSDVRSEFDLPDVESRAGFDVLNDSFGGVGAGATGTIVFSSSDGFDTPGTTESIQEFLAAVDEIPDTTITSPFDPPAEDPAQALAAMSDFLGDDLDPALLSGQSQISEDGTIAYAQVELPDEFDQEAATEFAEEVQDIAPEIDGVRIEYGGQVFSEFGAPSSELLGLAFAIVILILAGGSVLAMGLPIGVALAGIGVGSTLLLLLSNLMTTPDFATTLGVMIGLGVGIDYALFIVTRYREQLRAGHTVEESVCIAIDTSGRAVMFAGITVVISLMGMFIMGVSFVNGLALGSATVVTITLLASLTLLPALLGFVGERIEVSRWRGIIAAGLVVVALIGLGLSIQPLIIGLPLAVIVLVLGLLFAPLKKTIPPRKVKTLRETGAYKWSRFVQARPWTIALSSAAVLLFAAIPVFSMRLGFSDFGNSPEDTTTRQAYDLLAEGFGPGSNGPLTLVTELDGSTDSAALVELTRQIAETPGVQSVSGPIPNTVVDPDADQLSAAIWQVQPETSPQDEATTALVKSLRSEVLPGAEPAGTDVLVTGFVAVTVDFSDYLAARLVWFFAAVLTLSFLLLMVVFRSLLVPLKAVVMNLLSIGAAYGLMVAVFQWGWGSAVLGIEPAPIEPFLPMMLFAIVFGLSMDYEVFLLSRIHEEWKRTGDSRESVADGLAATAKVITAAAAIMVFVFGSFILEADRPIKLMGFGLAIAVLLDATVVRMLLVPATMELLGDRNWWLPRWLDRIIPHVSVEGEAPVEDSVDGLVPPTGPGLEERTPEKV
ncbi:MAG: MMPL family transporter [Microthrixaceae bacterium]|nr:MMPL family transporter [Microthrixaceae bacterium]